MYTEEINKIALSSDDDKRLQTFDRATTYPYETNAFKSCKNEMLDICKATDILISKDCENEVYMTCNIFLKYIEANCKSKMKRYVKIKRKKCKANFNVQMINFDNYVSEKKTEHNPNCPHTPDKPYIILIIWGSGSGKTNLLFNLIEDQPAIDKIYLYAKDPYEAKYQHLITKGEGVGIDYFNDPKAFIEYSNDLQDVYKNINYYNPNKENKILIVFDDMIADMINNKKLNSIVSELFIRKKMKYLSCFYLAVIL